MAGVSNATSIKQLLQGLAGDGAQVLQGVVKSVDPLEIQAVNDEKLLIGPESALIPQHLTDYQAEITVDWQTESAAGEDSGPHQHALSGQKMILIHNALKIDELVYMLSTSNGKQYYRQYRTKIVQFGV